MALSYFSQYYVSKKYCIIEKIIHSIKQPNVTKKTQYVHHSVALLV